MMNVHPMAIVDPGAKIPASCKVGPYCIIGPDVQMGEGCHLVSHVTIEGPTKIGADNAFFPFCAIGMDPQDVTYKGEPTRLEIGDHNEIRECVTINRDTHAYGMNKVGLERRGFSKERIRKIQHAYKVLLASKMNTSQALEKLKSEADRGKDVAMLIRFIEASERGVIK